tara:strand:+ start:422 stop:817 length:396 start_codon:yes stop_codon:yes gene_type:complete
MSNELEVLAVTCGVTLLMWLPYVLARIKIVGLMALLSYRSDDVALPAWAMRAKRAHNNTIENLVPFAGLVIVAHLLNVTNDATYAAAVSYFGFRIAHYVVFIFGVPVVRTLTFAGCWLAQLCLLFQILITV